MKLPITALALACTLLTLAGAAPRTSGPASGGGRGASARSAGTGASAGLPDSVLARAAGREITVSDFRGAWSQMAPPQRPDSLTPESAAEFLDLLVGKELLGARASREAWVWTADESLKHEGVRDRLTLGIALDSALAETRRGMAAGTSDPTAVGEAARDSFFARQGGRWNEPLLERLAKAFSAIPVPSRDSSVFSQLRMMGAPPPVAAEDRPLAIVTARDGDFTTEDLIAAWSRLNPLARPRVSTPAQVQDLVKNGLFERALRRAALARGIERWPHVARQIERDREFIDVQHYVTREVYERIPMDSVTLAKFYEREADYWKLPLRARLLQLYLPSRAAALEMAVRLASAAEAESLAARAGRGKISYWAEISAESDSAMFARALRGGAGTVLGPDSTRTGWRVARVTEMLPPRYRTLGEVQMLVRRRWYDLEAERRIVELLTRLRREERVAINRRALAALVAR